MEANLLSEKIDNLKIGVVVPTYNNAKTLGTVIDGLLVYTKNIIVVNDGSTDNTLQLLQEYPQITTIHLETNQGKGVALKTGFKKAIQNGYKHAITIDSDGQHFPEDLKTFVEELENFPEEKKHLLLIGARNMRQVGVPKKSSFGNKFSNFWFWVETGIWLQDTQSGYRLYPLELIKRLHLKTQKFEFEIETIVKSAWEGAVVKNVPVKIHYELQNRISHFRPFQDFTRISILNTYLVFLTFFYVKPRNTFKKIKNKGAKRFLLEDVLKSKDSPSKKALSIALGVFIGLSPLWGFHTVTVLFLAMTFNLNKAIAFAFSNVSLPPFIPFVIFAGLQTGAMILGIESNFNMHDITANFNLSEYLQIYLIGSFLFSIVSASLIGLVSYFMLSTFSVDKSQANV